MNIYDSILNFKNEFKNSEEVKSFREAKEILDKEPESKKMVDDFHEKVMEYQVKMNSGQNVESLEKEIQNLNMILMANSKTSSFLQAEVRVSSIMNDIMKMLEDTLK